VGKDKPTAAQIIRAAQKKTVLRRQGRKILREERGSKRIADDFKGLLKVKGLRGGGGAVLRRDVDGYLGGVNQVERGS